MEQEESHTIYQWLFILNYAPPYPYPPCNVMLSASKNRMFRNFIRKIIYCNRGNLNNQIILMNIYANKSKIYFRRKGMLL